MSRTLFITLSSLVIAILGMALLYIAFSGAPQTPPILSTSTPSGTSTSTSQMPNPAPLKNNVAPAAPSPTRSDTEIMAWIYPGEPACGTPSEYSDGRKIDILKPEYFLVSDGGKLLILTQQGGGCNGYSTANIASVKKYSKEQYVTVSSNYAVNMNSFLIEALNDNSSVNTLVSFVLENKITGVEIDFEDFGGWNTEMYSNYKKFITNLGSALHKNDKKLIIDGPPTANQTEENWYVWRYNDFISLPVDRIVVMTYDNNYDTGVGQPISPISWIQNTIKWTLSRFPDKSRLSFGIPSYGYKGILGTSNITLLTYDEIKKESGFGSATRDSASGELTWQSGNNVYFYQDFQSMAIKLKTIEDLGITSVSVWHLGGNPWFAKN